jgi:hypothetical protein
MGRAQTVDPRLDSWFTTYSARYARIYTNAAAAAARTPALTWNNGSQAQNLPAYSGVQEVDSSASWIYVRSTGLGSHILGPWSVGFPNLPINTKTLFRLPRAPVVAATKSLTGLGAIGYFVDGVAMFDSRDGFYWNGSTEANGAGYWNRDAYVNESATFDPANAHQPNSGMYHYHANPIALRYLLGDHVDYNAASQTYSEQTNPPVQHSPILAWVADGYPLYGPYGYSNATNPASGVRRMLSGYVLRNGQNGTQNLAATGRTNIPPWAVRLYNVPANQTGPNVSTSYPLGRYLEDNDYLGDLGKTQGIDFDLDEFNGRWCLTPEFPNGTYAYFVSILSNGTPLFPYNIGRAYNGNPTGGSVGGITETVTTNFLGGPDSAPNLGLARPDPGTVTLTWSAAEGGKYRVDFSSNLTSWAVLATNVASVQTSGQLSTNTTAPADFYRVVLSSLAAYDPVSGGGGGGSATITLSPAAGTPGNTLTVTATLSTSATPPVPPAGAPVQSFTIGGLSVTGLSHPTQYSVSGGLTIPSGAAGGAQTVTIVFSPPPGQPNGPSYTQANGFTID